FCSLLAPSDAILFQEGVSVKLRLPQYDIFPGTGSQNGLLNACFSIYIFKNRQGLTQTMPD
ncbi:hypothetical protein, partial [Escherichia coli]|uniref:hypothetical protein n=1 Tax=Escherichia coli TaxID=562 RepID=UPI001A7E139E